MSDKEGMSRFHGYEPDQAMLLPPNVRDVLGADHLCFHVHRVIEALEMSEFEGAYASEGRQAYPPQMMLKVWLYAFCLGVTSTRRLEQRIREDLAFRYLAGGLGPDHKTLSEFVRRHRGAINDEVVKLAEPLLNVPVPNTVVPFINETISPSGGAPPLEVTPAVKVAAYL